MGRLFPILLPGRPAQLAQGRFSRFGVEEVRWRAAIGAAFSLGTTRGLWGLVASMYIGNVALLLLNLPLVGLFVRLLRVPRRFLMPAVAVVSFVAVYAVTTARSIGRS